MRNLIVLTIATGVLVGGASLASADPNLPDVGAHRHFIQTPSGLVQVGPRLCDDASLQHAFNEFHFNVHHSGTSPTGHFESLGPQEGAPGLHNATGAEITARPCSFTG